MYLPVFVRVYQYSSVIHKDIKISTSNPLGKSDTIFILVTFVHQTPLKIPNINLNKKKGKERRKEGKLHWEIEK